MGSWSTDRCKPNPFKAESSAASRTGNAVPLPRDRDSTATSWIGRPTSGTCHCRRTIRSGGRPRARVDAGSVARRISRMARPQYLVSTRRFTPAYRRKRIEEFLIATEPHKALSGLKCPIPVNGIKITETPGGIRSCSRFRPTGWSLHADHPRRQVLVRRSGCDNVPTTLRIVQVQTASTPGWISAQSPSAR